MILDNYDFEGFFINVKYTDILITGGTGSLGNALTKVLCNNGYEGKLTILSRNESNQVDMREKFKEYPIEFITGDIKDKFTCRKAMSGKNIVIHAAGFKHVPQGELQPIEVVKSNIIGSMNIIEAADWCLPGDARVICISTDKACSPFNVYGMSKNIMARMFTEANKTLSQSFFTARYGNVLGSAGSVVPIWKNAIERGAEFINITDPDMTRFSFIMEEACRLIFWCLDNCRGGEEVGAQMSAYRLGDWAEGMIEGADTKIKQIATRFGEKQDEELFNKEELLKSTFLNDLIIFDRFAESEGYCNGAWNSKECVRINKNELREMLDNQNLLPKDIHGRSFN